MRALPLAACTLLLLSACVSGGATPSESSSAAIIPTGPSATAQVHDATGRLLGTLTLVDNGGRLVTVGTLRGLPPGTHGIHLHTVGSCEAPAFTSAGAHWNPGGRMHGFDNPQGPHQGDMRNVVVGADSGVQVNTTTMGGTLRGTDGALDADGLSIVVHAAADDYRTDPSGNSGARIACGVVTSAP